MDMEKEVAPAPKRRGFAAMDPARQREISSKGGRAAHESGNANEFTPQAAREAGSKGGRAAHQNGTAHEFTSAEARVAGAKGGLASRGGRRAAQRSALQSLQSSTVELT